MTKDKNNQSTVEGVWPWMANGFASATESASTMANGAWMTSRAIADQAMNAKQLAASTSNWISGFWNSNDSEQVAEIKESTESAANGAWMASCFQRVVTSTKGSSAVIISRKLRPEKFIPYMRFDKPHCSVDYKHLNINKRFTGIPDPHIPLSDSSFVVAQCVGKTIEKINKLAAPVAIATTAARLGSAMVADYNDGTYTTTVKEGAKISGEYAGGYAGANLGAYVGTFLWPGIGTMVGGIAGGIGGAIAAGEVAFAAMDSEKISNLIPGLPVISYQDYLPTIVKTKL